MKKTIGTHSRAGFTLIELLVVITIIGALSAIGTVSYQSVRMAGRDVKRASDMKQIQTALELYFENHQTYPFDQHPGIDGLPLGFDATDQLSDSGFAPEISGTPYMIGVPRNPQPGGTEYVYRSLYRDGRDCSTNRGCESYAILFTLEAGSGSLNDGPHALTPQGIAGEEGGEAGAGVVGAGGLIIGLKSTQQIVSKYTMNTAELVSDVVDDERVEDAAEAAAPVVAGLAIANAALTVHSSASLAALMLYFFTQPAMLFGRKRRKAWGTVYNSLSKLPVDLAIVRLLDAETGTRVKTVATDVKGRFSFLVSEGKYRMEVAKAGFKFPSGFVVDVGVDGHYEHVYDGGDLEVGEEGTLLTPSVPVDPHVEEETEKTVTRKLQWKRARVAVAVLSPAIGVVAFVIAPNILTGLLLAAQLISYKLFKRLAVVKEPKKWGFVYEKGFGKAIPRVVLRIFALPYHKLVETQVSDGRGRYHFRVGSGKFYLTAVKSGFEKTESNPLNLEETTEPTVIASDIPLMREGEKIPAPLPGVKQGGHVPGKKSELIVKPGARPTKAGRAGEGAEGEKRRKDDGDDPLDILPRDEG
ncbi:MAG: prepilin-type N-terminal cleavage/methylation domain-containing protein [Patescibacteria group bacterium]|nr:prepilin-type N-terminal cleavage/methylation domain-containing protein [Patescibacteria group bacterium]